jgi:hypothetical protein
MTHNPNDLELSDQMRVLFNNFAVLDMHNRNKELTYLFNALDHIEDAARKAKWVLGDYRDGRRK